MGSAEGQSPFAGRYPRGLFAFSAGALKWSVRVSAYSFWLRDEYPPFSLTDAFSKRWM